MNKNFPIHCAEHLQLAMQLVGKSATELLAILSDKNILLSDDSLEISLGNATLSGMLNFAYSSFMDAWLHNGFLFRFDRKYEWCISVEGVLTVS